MAARPALIRDSTSACSSTTSARQAHTAADLASVSGGSKPTVRSALANLEGPAWYGLLRVPGQADRAAGRYPPCCTRSGPKAGFVPASIIGLRYLRGAVADLSRAGSAPGCQCRCNAGHGRRPASTSWSR